MARPQFLDHTLLHTPTLALDALAQELERAETICRRIVVAVLRGESSQARMAAESTAVVRLLDVIADYCQQLQQSGLSPDVSRALDRALRAMQDIEETTACARSVSDLAIGPAPAVEGFIEYVVAWLQSDDPMANKDEAALEARYEEVKAQVLQAAPELGVRAALRQLDRLAAVRRCARSSGKSRRHLMSMQDTEGGVWAPSR